MFVRLVVTSHWSVMALVARARYLSTYSVGSRRKNRSMAAEKAAKARPPPSTPVGPEFRARIPPATNPAATGFTMSFRARYCREINRASATANACKMFTNRFYDTFYASKQGPDLTKPLSTPPHTTTHIFEYFLCFLCSVQVLSEKGVFVRERRRHHGEECTNSKALRRSKNRRVNTNREDTYLQRQQWLFLRDKTP